MASLVRVFKVSALEPVYRMSLLISFSFLLVAPLPLLFHLGHPERCLEVMMTPHVSSPMAMFGFVYAWYIMAVLLLELRKISKLKTSTEISKLSLRCFISRLRI